MRFATLLLFAVLATTPLTAQTPSAAAVDAVTDPAIESGGSPAQTPAPPPIRRWLEWQALTVNARFRYVETSADVVTAKQIQYKDVVRGRLNLDASKRYTVNVGLFTGQNFIGTWNTTDIGTGDLVFTHSLKQLYLSATPVPGLELQYGGLYIVRGESSEITSYDDDGYLVGERVSLRRPGQLFVDEVSVTRGVIGPYGTPALTDRWEGLHDANYHQVLVARHVGRSLKTSADYTEDQGNHTVRAALAYALPRGAPVSSLRYEQYLRTSGNAAGGFALTADAPLGPRARVVGGYATVDELYGGWNADKMQRGRRVFGTLSVPLGTDVTLQFFGTRAFVGSYAIANRTRADVQLSWDLLKTLQRARVF